LILYINTAGIWKSKFLEEKVCQVISDVEFEKSLWLQLNDQSIFSFNKEEVKIYEEISLLTNDNYRLMVLDMHLVLYGEKSAYKWNKNNDKFESTLLEDYSEHLKHSDIFRSGSDHIWGTIKDVSGGFALWEINHITLNIPYYEIPARKQFGQIIDINETEDYLWIVGNRKIMRLSKNINSSIGQNPVLVQSVVISYNNDKLSEVFIRQNDRIGFRKNKLTFILKSQRYLTAPNLYFRYKLTHYQDEWSDWTRDNKIVTNHLHERKYTLEAQAISSLGLISDSEIFEFTITPPFYRKWYAIAIYVFLILILSFLIYKWRLLSLKKVEFKVEERIRERMASVLQEKEKSDKLVADLFPKGTAEEIKTSGRAKSKKFEMATVLFSDIQGFTKIAEEMNPEDLIDELDKIFFHFDSVVEKYNIEKIKTIGDAYMAAGGIPIKNSSNPIEVVLAGLEMQYYMNDLKKKKTDIWDLRIGIHTGPIISGVVGSKKLSYDIWGDPVNTASRMESSGEGGKVNISGMTYNLIKDYFLCEYRGKLPVKYKGNIEMYFVTGLRPELSVDLQGIPNKRFFIKLQLLRLTDVEEKLFEEILEDQLVNLHFHKPDFIRKVFDQVELISRSENITDDELLLTQTAALLLYSGLSETYENYENKSSDIARTILPEYGYDEKQIDRVCNLILAAKKPFNPQNKLEEILIDSKMEYIGRVDYLTHLKLLFLEMKNTGRDISVEKLIRKQTAILKEFKYFTVAAQRLREVDAETQIENLKSWK